MKLQTQVLSKTGQGVSSKVSDDITLNIESHSLLAALSCSPDLLRTLPIGPHNAITLASPPNLIVIKVVDGQRQLVSFNAVPKPSPESLEGECSRILWHSNPAPLNGEPKITLTSMFPLDLDRIIQGYCSYTPTVLPCGFAKLGPLS